jgi:hypothetical protein
MIPNRFATEYPERCLELLNEFEPIARERGLLGTFSVMLASSVLLVPLERVKASHPLSQEHQSNLSAALGRLDAQKWHDAEFWNGLPSGEWRFSRIMADANNTYSWQDKAGNPSFSPEANTIERRTVREVLYVLRNALAHGNIIYLASNGHEEKGSKVEHLAFLSRCEPDAAENNTFQLVTVKEADFLPFIKSWVTWIRGHHGQHVDDNVL